MVQASQHTFHCKSYQFDRHKNKHTNTHKWRKKKTKNKKEKINVWHTQIDKNPKLKKEDKKQVNVRKGGDEMKRRNKTS